MSAIRRKLSEQGHSNLTIDIILASWRDSTKSQYQSSLNKWLDFCIKKDVDIISPSVAEAMAFLTFLYESNLSYSSINTARSALSSFLQLESSTPFGQLAIVKRFMKGIYELRPCFPRHHSVWNVTTVFDYFRKQKTATELSLKELSVKVAFLLCLLSGQRCQTIVFLDIRDMDLLEDRYIFHVKEKLKQSRAGYHIKPLEFMKYSTDEKLCVFTHLQEYIKRTENIRLSNTKLLISFIKPHGPISTDTLARWIKLVLASAGIDTKRFTAHSTRAASSSHLAQRNFSITDIIDAVGWKSEHTFQKFYNRSQDSFNFGNSILGIADIINTSNSSCNFDA